ncbi:agamous-like MADS-box protein AGL66 [Solanum stenotomum]|uniref:agamous-like MADS-box protein AGL66 n=1 Tax=Solanum stenotomum TaxID=172797 RepID=UPI0020D0C050|nr:agamous-like MADS-box protein AGL66 [Solanum stenotomum]
MGRNKIVMKKIEDPGARQQFYSKRKGSIVKKSNELGVLCDTDIALLMFSPTGEVTTYSRGESFEDIMINAMKQPDELNRRSTPNPDEEHLMQSLAQSKSERKMIEKIAIVEAHMEKLNELKQTLSEAQEKISSYEPQVENINTVEEADAYNQYLLGAMERIQRSKAKLLANQEFLQRNENVAMAWVNAEDMSAAGND